MKNWFHSLAPREQGAVSIGLFVVSLIGIYLFVIKPVGLSLEQAAYRVAARDTEYRQLQQLAQEYAALAGSGDKAASMLNRSLLSLIDQSSQEAGIKPAIKRLTPEGERKVRVHFENADFNRIVGWLVNNYQKAAISVETLNIRNTEKSGVISGTVMMVR